MITFQHIRIGVAPEVDVVEVERVLVEVRDDGSPGRIDVSRHAPVIVQKMSAETQEWVHVQVDNV
jgi:hypothetical protein